MYVRNNSSQASKNGTRRASMTMTLKRDQAAQKKKWSHLSVDPPCPSALAEVLRGHCTPISCLEPRTRTTPRDRRRAIPRVSRLTIPAQLPVKSAIVDETGAHGPLSARFHPQWDSSRAILWGFRHLGSQFGSYQFAKPSAEALQARRLRHETDFEV